MARVLPAYLCKCYANSGAAQGLRRVVAALSGLWVVLRIKFGAQVWALVLVRGFGV